MEREGSLLWSTFDALCCLDKIEPNKKEEIPASEFSSVLSRRNHLFENLRVGMN